MTGKGYEELRDKFVGKLFDELVEKEAAFCTKGYINDMADDFVEDVFKQIMIEATNKLKKQREEYKRKHFAPEGGYK